MSIMLVSDIIEDNGLTIRQNNLLKQHNPIFKIGTLVECEETGIRAFIANLSRDCDGTPLYDLTIHEIKESYLIEDSDDQQDKIYKRFIGFELLRHFSEESLTVIKLAKEL